MPEYRIELMGPTGNKYSNEIKKDNFAEAYREACTFCSLFVGTRIASIMEKK